MDRADDPFQASPTNNRRIGRRVDALSECMSQSGGRPAFHDFGSVPSILLTDLETRSWDGSIGSKTTVSTAAYHDAEPEVGGRRVRWSHSRYGDLNARPCIEWHINRVAFPAPRRVVRTLS